MDGCKPFLDQSQGLPYRSSQPCPGRTAAPGQQPPCACLSRALAAALLQPHTLPCGCFCSELPEYVQTIDVFTAQGGCVGWLILCTAS